MHGWPFIWFGFHITRSKARISLFCRIHTATSWQEQSRKKQAIKTFTRYFFEQGLSRQQRKIEDPSRIRTRSGRFALRDSSFGVKWKRPQF
jgi:hypothetical protein